MLTLKFTYFAGNEYQKKESARWYETKTNGHYARQSANGKVLIYRNFTQLRFCVLTKEEARANFEIKGLTEKDISEEILCFLHSN